MKYTVSAVIPSDLVSSLGESLIAIFPESFIIDAVQALTLGSIGIEQVYCFSGEFSPDQLNQLSALSLSLPGITYWVQDPAGVVLLSNREQDLGLTSPAVELIRSAGVSFPQVLSS